MSGNSSWGHVLVPRFYHSRVFLVQGILTSDGCIWPVIVLFNFLSLSSSQNCLLQVQQLQKLSTVCWAVNISRLKLLHILCIPGLWRVAVGSLRVCVFMLCDKKDGKFVLTIVPPPVLVFIVVACRINHLCAVKKNCCIQKLSPF